MKFRIVKDGTNEDVLGGLIELENVYISTYGSLVSGKRPADLEVGESCRQRYAVSMTQPTIYKIIRVE